MKEIKDLQVGDEVIVETCYCNRIGKVERLTKTCVVVNGVKYKKDYGNEYGYHGYYPNKIKVATEELKAKVLEEEKRNQMLGKIQSFRFGSLPTNKLKQVCDIISNENK